MTSTHSLAIRHEKYLSSFHDHLELIEQLHQQALQELLPKFIQTLNSTRAIKLATRYLNDKINLFRFLSRNHFDLPLTLLALSQSIQWRLEFKLDLLSSSSLEPIYFDNPLLFFHSDLKDKWGRHSAILNLKYLSRTQDGGLDAIKEFIAWVWELARKSIYASNPDSFDLTCSNSNSQSTCFPSSSSSFPSTSQVPPTLQVTLIVDLKDASMYNLELELLPYLIDLVKNNFPDMVGAIFILNYGWMYAGMWQVVKRILTPATLDRIVFLSHSELLQFFDGSNLLVEHGGSVVHAHGALQNPFMNRFGKPAASTLSDTPEFTPYSRHPSVESIHDIFFSAANTPHHQSSYPGTPRLSANFNSSHRRHSGLNMTSYRPSHFSSNSISDGLNKQSIFPSEWSQASLARSNFHLKFPARDQEKDEEISQDPSVRLLASDRLSGFSSSSSLSETGKRSLGSNHQDEVEEHHTLAASRLTDSPRLPSVKYRKRKRDYFCIRLIIKFGYVLRTLQMSLRILTLKVFHSRQHHQRSISATSNDPHLLKRRLELDNACGHRLHHLPLHHLFLILNLQRKKMISTFGCLLFFLIFFKKKSK